MRLVICYHCLIEQHVFLNNYIIWLQAFIIEYWNRRVYLKNLYYILIKSIIIDRRTTLYVWKGWLHNHSNVLISKNAFQDYSYHLMHGIWKGFVFFKEYITLKSRLRRSYSSVMKLIASWYLRCKIFKWFNLKMLPISHISFHSEYIYIYIYIYIFFELNTNILSL